VAKRKKKGRGGSNYVTKEGDKRGNDTCANQGGKGGTKDRMIKFKEATNHDSLRTVSAIVKGVEKERGA